MKLSEDQQNLIIETWNSSAEEPPSLQELTKLLFPHLENIDGRSKEGRAIKEFLATRNIKPKTTSKYDKKERVELTDDQKEFINNNFTLMTYVEVARVLFKNNNITNLSIEAITVKEYIDSIQTNEKPFETSQELPP